MVLARNSYTTLIDSSYKVEKVFFSFEGLPNVGGVSDRVSNKINRMCQQN